MARRREKDDRRSSQKTASSIPGPARPRDPSPGRGTFAVARARRVLAEELPQVVVSGRAPIRSISKVSASTEPEPLRMNRPPMPKPKALRDEAREPLNMRDRDDETCKGRPSSSRGSGGSRPFVPWCSRKS